MSVYTTQLLNVFQEIVSNDETISYSERRKMSPIQLMEHAQPKIFDFDYPCWSAEHKPVLERKILLHYFNYEIAMETYPLWKIYFEARMNEIMPYYVDKYNAIYPYFAKIYKNVDYDDTYDETIEEDIDNTFDETVDDKGNQNYTRDNDVTTTDHSHEDKITDDKGTRNSTEVFSDLPQTTLNELDYATTSTVVNETTTDHNVVSDTIDSNGTMNQDIADKSDYTSNKKTDNTRNIDRNQIKSYKFNEVGLKGKPYAELIAEYQKEIQNLDMEIIKDLADMFMTIF